MNKSYCSPRCRSHHYNTVKYATHRRAIARRRVRTKYHRTCNVCGVFYTGAGSQYCSRKCQNVDFRKRYALEKNPAWLGGLSYAPYPITFNSSLKEAIKNRDGFKCQVCGVPQTECVHPLCVHHIDYNKDNCSVGNLITLCKICHIKTNSKRNYWKEYFMDKERVLHG